MESKLKIISIFELVGNSFFSIACGFQLSRMDSKAGTETFRQIQLFSMIAELSLSMTMIFYSALLTHAIFNGRPSMCKSWLIARFVAFCTRDLYWFTKYFYLTLLTNHPTADVFLFGMTMSIGFGFCVWKIIFNYYSVVEVEVIPSDQLATITI